MPANPPPRAAAASTPSAAINAITSSISSSDVPATRNRTTALPANDRLLVLDVGVDAGAADLAVLAQDHQVERAALAGGAVLDRVTPRILELGFLGIRPEPATRIGRLRDQFLQVGRQAAGVHLERLDLA